MANFVLFERETDPAKGLRWQLAHDGSLDESGVHDFQSPQEVIGLAMEALDAGSIDVDVAWSVVVGAISELDGSLTDVENLVRGAAERSGLDEGDAENLTEQLVWSGIPSPCPPSVRELALEVLRDLDGEAGWMLFATLSDREMGVEVWAADRTPLPEWAEIYLGSVGGMPDSDVPFLRLQPGKTLEDLRAWQREHPVDVTRF